MARSKLANSVAASRPKRAGSGVHAANGGTTAPGSAAKGPTIGLSGNQAFNTNHPGYVAQPAKSAAPAAPAAASPPSAPSALPWDAQAQQEVGEAGTEENDTLGELGASWAGRETYYGFGANGSNNPYSQAALLATHHEWNERGRQNSAGLQLYAGSNVNAEREETGRYTTSYGQLLQAYEAEKASSEAQEQRAKDKYNSIAGEGGSAQLGAIQRAAESTPPPVAPEEGGGGDGGGGGGGDKPGLGGDSAHPNAYRAGVGAGKNQPKAPPGYHAYKGPGNQWWFAPN